MITKKAMLAITLAVCGVIIFGVGAYLLVRALPSLARASQPEGSHVTPYVVHRSEEVPYSTHRSLSLETVQEATALLPWGIAVDYAHGFIWVAEPGCEPKPKCPAAIQGILGQYAYSDGNLIQNFSEPAGYSSPLFLAVDKDGNVWFTQPDNDAIGEFDIASSSWNQWLLERGSAPFDLVFDSSGNLWFTESGSNKIGFLNVQTSKEVENSIPTPNSNPYGITLDRSGTMWFTENAAGVDQIGSFTPTASGVIKISEHAAGGIRPHLIAADAAGNIWYSGGFDGDIGEYSPRSGNSTLFVVYHGVCAPPANCTGTHISGIEVDSKGNIWFTDSLSHRVGYLVPATGQVVEKTLATSNSHPYDGLLVDTSDRVWFTEEFGLTLSMLPASAFK